LNQLRQKFFDDTATLRSDLWAKQGELNALLNSPNPDQTKVRQLQDEVNDLRTKLSQKRLDFELEAKKIVPNAGPGPGMYGGGPGYGMHQGPYGPGHCWN
jgi:zinc resistance-associated protein